MRKKPTHIALILLIISILLSACSTASTIICGNCSTSNPNKNQYCSNCGTAFFQNSPTKPKNTQADDETIINAFKDDLQGHWVLKEDDYTYVVSFDFEYNNVSEGFYKSSAQEFQIKSLTIENHSTLTINAHYPGSDDPFDPIPAEDGTYRIFFTSTEKNQISLSYNNNEPVYFQYAGKTQEALAKECENDNESSVTGNNTTSNSNNSQTESNWDFRVDEGMSKSQVDGLWGSPIQITRYQDGSGYSCYYYDMYGNHRMVIYDNNYIVIYVPGDNILSN